jgi:hypothetical protein
VAGLTAAIALLAGSGNAWAVDCADDPCTAFDDVARQPLFHTGQPLPPVP